ncbi:hypothetical protein CE91St57_41020 [Lachnospiraceae bacterium]|nr:hypothetical protein CE91St57_41020 [Lachnospiraceae bacterium]
MMLFYSKPIPFVAFCISVGKSLFSEYLAKMPAVPAGIFKGCVCGSVAGLLSGRQKNPAV